MLYSSELEEGIRKWCIVGEERWRTFGANIWYIVGEDYWYMVGANAWYIIAEDYWYTECVNSLRQLILEFSVDR